MDIALDLNVTSVPETHYWGNTIWDETTGEFSLVDPQTNEPVAIWNGTQRIWRGTSTWAADESLWAGTQRIWGGTTPNASLNTATCGESLINE